MKRSLVILASLALALSATPALAAPVSTAFTYQGSLDKSGVPGSATCNFTFKLFDDPSTGAQIGPTLSPAITLVENGQFSVQLDFGAAFDGNARWLEIAVQCPGDASATTLAPRQPLTATPYALYALSGPGSGGGFTLPYSGPVTSAAQDAFKIQNNATGTTFSAIHGVSASSAGGGTGAVFGEATATTGGGLGVYGLATASPGGTGMVGKGGATGAWFESFATTGDGTGVWGVSHTSLNGAGGVKGVNYSGTGSTVGTWGVATSSMSGTGVAGFGGAVGGWFQEYNDASNIFADYAGVMGVGNFFPGVKGRSNSSVGVRGQGNIGVMGVANTGSSAAGVSGQGDGLGAGVQGFSTGSGPGLYGASSSGYGVSASSVNADGVNASSTNGYGVSGTTSVATKAGLYGTSAQGDGVWGQSGASFKSGVVGVSYNAQGYGGYFYNLGGGPAFFANGLAQVKTLQILGADLAESFPVKEAGIEPGTVVMIDDADVGALKRCDEAYSHRVAGVVSGANGLDAAVVLKGASFDDDGHAAVAMSGRVWVKCDATRDPIHAGDLLTTAGRAGHAMKASDHEKTYGAILGKAMSSLETGTGLVLVLVSLQ